MSKSFKRSFGKVNDCGKPEKEKDFPYQILNGTVRLH